MSGENGNAAAERSSSSSSSKDDDDALLSSPPRGNLMINSHLGKGAQLEKCAPTQ